MSALNTVQTPEKNNTQTISHSLISPQEAEVIFTAEHHHNAFSILQSALRENLYDVVHQLRAPRFNRHEVLLQLIHLNDHSAQGHVDQVTAMALALGRAFPEKVSEEDLQAVMVGGMLHDVAFMEAADAYVKSELRKVSRSGPNADSVLLQGLYNLENGLTLLNEDKLNEARDFWGNNSPVTHPHFGKKELDSHTHFGVDVFKDFCVDPSFSPFIDRWTPDQKRIAELTIYHHSNGSDYDPKEVPVAAKLVRAADKMDNLADRPASILDEHLLDDERKLHQFVPASLHAIELAVKRDVKQIMLAYHADTRPLEDRMRAFDSAFEYPRERLLEDFHKNTYGPKSMRYAAEVVSALFAEDGETHHPDATLKVRFMFGEGDIEEFTYEPLL